MTRDGTKGETAKLGDAKGAKRGCIVVPGRQCPFGVCCRFGMLNMRVGIHTAEEEVHFEGKRAGPMSMK